MSVFVDTNILVYSLITESPLNLRADAAIRLALTEGDVWLSNQVLRELTKALLHLSAITGNPEVAWVPEAIESCRQIYRLAEDSSAVFDELLRLLQRHSLPAKQIHDANIVATMRVHGISKLLTHNPKDFSVFRPHIEVLGI